MVRRLETFHTLRQQRSGCSSTRCPACRPLCVFVLYTERYMHVCECVCSLNVCVCFNFWKVKKSFKNASRSVRMILRGGIRRIVLVHCYGRGIASRCPSCSHVFPEATKFYMVGARFHLRRRGDGYLHNSQVLVPGHLFFSFFRCLCLFLPFFGIIKCAFNLRVASFTGPGRTQRVLLISTAGMGCFWMDLP